MGRRSSTPETEPRGEPAPGARPARPTSRRVVGLVRGIYGLRGFVRIEVLTDSPELRFAPGARLFREASTQALTIAEGEPVPDGPGWRVRFSGLPTRTDVESLRDVYLEAEVEPPEVPESPGADADAPPTPVFWDEVIGVPVRAADGEELGTVRDVYRAGEREVYVVEGGTRGPFDLPAVRDFVVDFAPRERRIVVDVDALDLPPPGPRRRVRGRKTVRAARAAGVDTNEPTAEAGA
jgi:16S rRNA processing protein RimM